MRLQENLVWLKDSANAKKAVVTETDVSLANKLAALSNLKRCPGNASNDEITQYMMRKFGILKQMLPLISQCTPEFKQTYVMGNEFVRYVVAMTVKNQHLLTKEILTEALDFLVVLESPDVRDVLFMLLGALHKMPDTETLCLKHCNNLLLLLQNTGGRVDTNEIYDLVTSVIFKVIIAGIDIDALGAALSVLHIMREHYPEDKQLQELTTIYIGELKRHIYALEPAALLNVLQFMYRTAYADDALYTSAMEALLYNFDLMTSEEKSTLLLMLPFLKHMCLLLTPNIATNVYSEECQMLNAALRKEFEHKIEYMPFEEMITFCLAISLMFKQSGVVRKLLLKNIQKPMVAAVDGKTFLKLLACCNTLHINSSYVDVSRLLSKMARGKLAGGTGPELLQAFKSLAQISAKRHRKYLIPLVQDALEKNKSDVAAIIDCLHLYVTLNMQRINANVLESGFSLLFPHLNPRNQINVTQIQCGSAEVVTDKVAEEVLGHLSAGQCEGLGATGEGVMVNDCCDPSSVSTPAHHEGTLRTDNKMAVKKDTDLLYIAKSGSVAKDIPLRGLIKLLECLTKVELDISHVQPIASLIQTSILQKVKYNSTVSMVDLTAVLKQLTESRIVCAELADVILDRVYNCPDLLDDLECAATILQFIEFTNHGDYATKLSQPLFEFCLRKPTTTLMEVLDYQKYRRPDFYTAYMEMMQPAPYDVPDRLGGVVEHTPIMGTDVEALARDLRLPQATGGKSHHVLKQWIDKHDNGHEYVEFHKIDNLVVDFYYPGLRTAVQVIKRQDYYACHRGVHLKSKMWLFCDLLRMRGIRVIVVPETRLQAENVAESTHIQIKQH
ncbi:hypothetical protein, conserved [Babesia bigemina]|uniref:RAP domain-containing protein n=1 Tax=Babesia bigemina TaxID=5866 RepID=A0A061DC34_BABBI|nr:hypothetical protein, conserved [Babesia bigemina]CDR96489.1 hypothetical protein, conserved [Babesia bigemina]|eukprot:XP_012768675.1 hypothetical protein, conserved [Babesia bigemina]